MKFKQYEIEFTQKALSVGFSYDEVVKCINYAKPIIEKELPVIYNISHFSGLVGYKQSYIERSIVFTYHFYRQFSILKSNQSFRKISEPLPGLKEIQTWVLNNILYKIKPSRFAKAYIPGTTLKQNLVFHKGQSVVLSIDIKDFFSNLKRPLVENLFIGFGYSKIVSDLLSKICTLNDKLPQGAPTSPYISNLVMRDFDEAVSVFCLKNKVRYTRYADDMTFSGDFNVEHMVSFIRMELQKLSLIINEEKVHIMPQGIRQVVTGVVVNNKLQVSRKKRKQIRQAIYYIRKLGVSKHLEVIKSSKSNYIDHLLGQVLFVLFINPEDNEFVEYKGYLTGLKNDPSASGKN